MFGPNGQQVLMLIAAIPGLSADQVDQVTVAWKQGSPDSRARAWAHLSRAAGEDERYGILAAASLARREALETARRVQRADWAFWAAACDAGAAAAAGKRIGSHYDALIAPFAGVVAILAADPAPVSLLDERYPKLDRGAGPRAALDAAPASGMRGAFPCPGAASPPLTMHSQ
jgi:hypothetical protein